MNATPHMAQNTSGRSSAIDGRTARHAGYAMSQRIRKRIEEAFGWIKTVAGQERTKFRGQVGAASARLALLSRYARELLAKDLLLRLSCMITLERVCRLNSTLWL